MPEKLWFVSNGRLKSGQIWANPARNTYKGSPAPAGFSPGRVEYRELVAKWGLESTQVPTQPID